MTKTTTNTSHPTPKPSGWELLKTRDFGFLFAGQLISQIGDSLNKVALLWFVYAITGSALKMTVIGLLQTIPPLAFGPLIGVYLDRLPKKMVMVTVDFVRTFLVLLIPILHSLDALSLERLYVLVFLTAIVSTIFGPALSSAVPEIVPRARLTAANALIQSTTNIGLLIGPVASGVGIALIGAQNVLYVDAGTFLVSALCLLPIRFMISSPASHEGRRGTFGQDLMVGIRFVFLQHKTVLMLMVTATMYTLGVSAFGFLLPVVATQLLSVGSVGLGWLWSALGLGMLLTSVWLASMNHGDIRSRLKLVACSLGVGGLAVFVLSFLTSPVPAAVLVAMIGGSTALFTPVVWTLLQEMTPVHLLGRVFTTFTTGSMASAMAGMAGFGWAADAIGADASLLGIAAVLLLTAAITAHFSLNCKLATANQPLSEPAPRRWVRDSARRTTALVLTESMSGRGRHALLSHPHPFPRLDDRLPANST
jgi:MFS family permease